MMDVIFAILPVAIIALLVAVVVYGHKNKIGWIHHIVNRAKNRNSDKGEE